MLISIDNLFKDVSLTLSDYAKGVDRAMAKANEEAGMYAEQMLHNISPRRTGNYRESWTLELREVRKNHAYRNEMVVWNKKYYRLTHLLEKSHRIANKYGSYGMSKAQPHIEPTQREAEQEWARYFKRELERIRLS